MFSTGTFTVLWSIMTCSLGFTMDRSVFVASTWDTAPSLDTYQRVLVDPVSNGTMQSMGMRMSKIFRVADAKTLTKLTGKMLKNPSRERRSDITTDVTGIKHVGDPASIIKNDFVKIGDTRTSIVVIPRNVILLLIDGKGENTEMFWQKYKKMLPLQTEGFLQSCRDQIANVSVDNTLVSENHEKGVLCDCEYLLRLSIEELLSWARHRGMTTSAVSDSNFSIPFFPIHETPNNFSSEFSDSNESDAKLKVRRSKDNADNVWQVIDLDEQAKSVPILFAPDSTTEAVTNYNGIWDIFDVFSKIRIAFLRSLLESLRKNDGTPEDKFSSSKLFLSKPTLVNLLENTVKELRSLPNDNGYMLVAVASGNDGTGAIDLLLRESSPKDTLLVVMYFCSGDMTSIPFVAQGPNHEILREVKAIWEFPSIIRKTITNGCPDFRCANRRRRNVPTISHKSTEISSQELLSQERVSRNVDVLEKLKKATNETNIKTAVKSEGSITTEKEKQVRSSATLKTTSYSIATEFGIATSILTSMIVLTSS